MPQHTKRLSDKILVAFHQACDLGDFEVAVQLLHVLDMMLAQPPLTPGGHRRRSVEGLVAAHERLWDLRHPHHKWGFLAPHLRREPETTR